MASCSTLLYSVFFAVSAVITSVSATEYQVGGVIVGWRLPVVNETQLYNVWASRRRFYVGDSLRFVYGYDSLVVVEKWGFYHCDPSKPDAFFNDGDTVINLDKAGPMYFISGDADRCKQGLNMKVEVMNPGPVRYFPPSISNPPSTSNPPPTSNPPSISNPPPISNPPSISNPPENPFSAIAPSPSQFLSPGGSPEMSPGPSPSDSATSFAVSSFVTAVINVGLGLWALKA